MKKYITIVLISILGVFSMSAQKEMDQFKIQVDGLGCPFCAYGLEKKFKEFKGIKNVQIEIQTGDFQFSYPSEKQLTMDAIVNQVKKAGYTPKTANIIRFNGEEEELTVIENSKKISKKAVSETYIVKGNCEMCKIRIETTALQIEGVEKAIWEVKSKELNVVFNAKKTSKKEIVKSLLKAGHDTEGKQAEKESYANLPACCSYNNPNLKSN